jgi:hypothetical protein
VRLFNFSGLKSSLAMELIKRKQVHETKKEKKQSGILSWNRSTASKKILSFSQNKNRKHK